MLQSLKTKRKKKTTFFVKPYLINENSFGRVMGKKLKQNYYRKFTNLIKSRFKFTIIFFFTILIKTMIKDRIHK